MKNNLTLLLIAVIVWGAYQYRKLELSQRVVSDEPSHHFQGSSSLPPVNDALTSTNLATPWPPGTISRPFLQRPFPTPFGFPVQPAPTPVVQTPPAPAVLNAIVTISGHEGAGTGFICNFRGKPYVATNQHVLSVGDGLTIRTSSGIPIVPSQIFAATDADIALVQCASIPPGTTALDVATLENLSLEKDNATLVPGNSKGDGVITQTPGKLLAIGPQRIEVDNPVYPGNSGSPIIHVSSKQVIGVLTEAELVSFNEFEKASFRSKDSSIKSTIRYFGYRLDSVRQWEGLNWSVFQRTEALLKQSRDELDAILAYLTTSSSSYKKFRELHETRNAAATIFNDRHVSNADKIEAYEGFLRDVARMAQRAKARLDSQKVYFSQQHSLETITRMSDVIVAGIDIAQRDNDLAAKLLDQGE